MRDDAIAITGLGLVSAAGRGLDVFWDSCAARRSHLRDLSQMDSRDLVMGRGGEVPEEFFQGCTPEERAESMAAAALEDALSMARFGSRRNGELAGTGLPVGLALGTALGSSESVESAARRPGPQDVSSTTWQRAPLNRLTRGLARRFELAGPQWTFSVTCVSGLYAIEQATADLQFGRASAMLCGGIDTLSLFMQSGFCSLRALSLSGEVRPFDRGHDGIVLGEGAAFLVLELLSAAHARGARVLGVLAGNRLVSDASHMTSPDASGRGMAEAIVGALDDAGLEAGDLACITPTAVGSPVYDGMQSRAILDTLGAVGTRIPVTTWEPVVGHALASTGVLGIVHATLAMNRGEVLPTFGLEDRDEDCRLDYVLDVARPLEGEAILALTVGFGGQNGATIVRRVPDKLRPEVEGLETAVPPSCARIVAAHVVGGVRETAEGGGVAVLEAERVAEMFPGRWNGRRELPRGVDVLVGAIAGAAEEAGWWQPGTADLMDGGLIVGTDYQSLCVASRYARDLAEEGPAGISPGDFLYSLPSSAAAVVGILFGLRDYQATLSGGGQSGFLALCHGLDRLTRGKVSRMVVGVLSLVTPEMAVALRELGHVVGEEAPDVEMAVAFCLEAVTEPDRGGATLRFDSVSSARSSVGDPDEQKRGGNVPRFPHNTEAWLDDLSPGHRSLAAPSLLALLRACQRSSEEGVPELSLTQRDPNEDQLVTLGLEPGGIRED